MCSHGDAPPLDPRTSSVMLPGYPRTRCSSEHQVPYLGLLPLDVDTKQYCDHCIVHWPLKREKEKQD